MVEPKIFGSVEIVTIVEGSPSDYDATFQESYRSACATQFGVSEDRVDVAIAPGSVIITVTVFATSSTPVIALQSVASTTFANAATSAAFISSSTGQAVTVTSVQIEVSEPATDGDDDSGHLTRGAIAGIVIGSVAGAALIVVACAWRKLGHREHAPHFDAGTAQPLVGPPSHASSSKKACSRKHPPTSYPDSKTPFAVAHSSAARQPVEFAENI